MFLILFHSNVLWIHYCSLNQVKKIEFRIFEHVDAENSSKEMKKSSLEFASRIRRFVEVSAAVCIGSSVDPRIFPSRMFGEASEVGFGLFGVECGQSYEILK